MIIAVIFLMAFMAIHTQSYFGDEGYHFEQMRRFREGNFGMNEQLTMLPGYHWFVAGPMFLTGMHVLNFYRAITIILSLLSVAVFQAILRTLKSRASVPRTLQYAFIPILFPFFFFFYTDVPSLLLILVSILLTLRRQYVFAALVCIVSMAVRQNNIVWLFLAFSIFLWDEWPAFLRWLPHRVRRWKLLSELRVRFRARASTAMIISALLLFGIGFCLFGAFVVWNGGIAIGDSDSHPFPAIHTGNIFFALLLSFFIFLPLHISNSKTIIRRVISSNFLAPMTALLFLLYMMTFHNDHWYNQGWDSVFIRNRILMAMTYTPFLKILFFIPIGCAFLSFVVTPLARRSFWLLYPIVILSLLPSWLIEERYYFVPFALFLLFREERSERFEYLSAGYSMLCTVLLFIPVALRWFFL